MDIKDRTVVVLGGWGLVGSSICRKIVEEQPKRIIVTSLLKAEAEEAVDILTREYPKLPKNYFIPWWGNIFVRHELKDISRDKILSDETMRQAMIQDMLDELTDTLIKRSAIYQLLNKYKPEILIDSINSATAIAYQDIFQGARDVIRTIKKAKSTNSNEELSTVMERMICTLYMPQLIRHVQLLYRSMHVAGTKIYVKIGTSGTGGMGLNIPYTHSEERPSSVLLGKSAVAGAHTMLLFLMGRTPDGAITKEVKPTAAIAWKKIDYGEIRRKGRPIDLVDCNPKRGIPLKHSLQIRMKDAGTPLNKTLKSVFIDTGENGIFSRGEFEAIAAPGQMEFVTPEEIAETVIYEIKGGNTGHDIINALDNASLSPTYRAGFLFNSARNKIIELEQKYKVDSVAFEVLGPPRLSKLLYEAYLLKVCCADMKSVLKSSPRALSLAMKKKIQSGTSLRSQIISIGIPILLPDGKTLLRGNEIKIPPFRGENEFPLSAKNIDLWSHDGWVDLRPSNMERWKKRIKSIIAMTLDMPPDSTSSRYLYKREYWNNFEEIDPGKLAGWIFNYEEKGMRMRMKG
ncbi:MAG: short-chain dehydrogenase [Bacteroidota bacterium]